MAAATANYLELQFLDHKSFSQALFEARWYHQAVVLTSGRHLGILLIDGPDGPP